MRERAADDRTTRGVGHLERGRRSRQVINGERWTRLAVKRMNAVKARFPKRHRAFPHRATLSPRVDAGRGIWRLDVSGRNESTPEACVKVAGGHAGGVATGLQGHEKGIPAGVRETSSSMSFHTIEPARLHAPLPGCLSLHYGTGGNASGVATGYSHAPRRGAEKRPISRPSPRA